MDEVYVIWHRCWWLTFPAAVANTSRMSRLTVRRHVSESAPSRITNRGKTYRMWKGACEEDVRLSTAVVGALAGPRCRRDNRTGKFLLS